MWIVFVLVQPRSLSVADSSEEVAIDLLLGRSTAHSILFYKSGRKQSTGYQFLRSLRPDAERREFGHQVGLKEAEYDRQQRRHDGQVYKYKHKYQSASRHVYILHLSLEKKQWIHLLYCRCLALDRNGSSGQELR
jgi:hypothetical protein